MTKPTVAELEHILSGADGPQKITMLPNGEIRAIPDDKAKMAEWMIAHGMATGHGDTIEDLIAELVFTCAERAQSVTANLYGEQSEDWQTGFDRGGNAAANAVREILHPQQPTQTEQ